MTIPRFDEVHEAPLVTDEQVLERATLLLECAIRRQLWLMFLDADDRQLPLLVHDDGVRWIAAEDLD